MATFAGVWQVISETVEQLDELEKFCRSNAKNWVDLEASYQAIVSQAPQYGKQSGAKMDADRTFLSAILSPDEVRGRIEPLLFDLANTDEFKSTKRDVFLLMGDLRDYMHGTASPKQYIKSRGMTLSTTFSAGAGNVGNGLLQRLTVDENGYALEATAAEAKSAKCTQDQNQTDKHAEIITLYGAPANKDWLKLQGSGFEVELTSLHAGLSAQFCQNPSFSDHDATLSGGEGALASATGRAGWTVAAGTYSDLKANTTSTYVYRTFPGETTGVSLRWTANATIRQVLQETQRPTFLPGTPIYVQVAVYRRAAATGQLVLTFGAQSTTVDLSTLSDEAWNIVRIAVGTGSWLKNFNAADLKVELALTSLAVGTIYTDDIIIGEMTQVDGTWYAFIGGNTATKRLDSWTWTDTEPGTRAKNAYWFWRAGLGHVNSTADATQVTASGGRTLSFANVGAADTITASSGSFITDGYKAGMLVTIAGSASNNMTTGQIVSVTATVISFGATTSLTNEGPVSATTTLNATAPIADGS
jgi:hypothetical protein